MEIRKITPVIGAEIDGVDFSQPLSAAQFQAIYDALLDNLAIFFRGADVSPTAHLALAQSFGQLDDPHPLYPHVDGHETIVLLENGPDAPPDTNSWHTDLTYKAEQPFASVLVARDVPDIGGDTMWSSTYAAYDRLPDGMKADLAGLEAVHDLGDFRNSFAPSLGNQTGAERLNDAVSRFGHALRPLIGEHPATGRKFLNFNESFVSHIVGMTTNASNALRIFLANHMNQPEFQMRWRWRTGDVAIWDNRVTMHYAISDYMPAFRSMNRVTVVRDRRVAEGVS